MNFEIWNIKPFFVHTAKLLEIRKSKDTHFKMNGEDYQIPHVQLFVKRSIMDNSHKSSCPICQRWFMVLFLKSEAKELALTVFPVNMKNPEPEFKEYHATPPVVVLVQENVVLTDNLRIEQYINGRFTSLDLSSDKEAENVCSDLYIVSLILSRI